MWRWWCATLPVRSTSRASRFPIRCRKFLPVNLARENGRRVHGFVPIEQLIIANLHHLFPGLEIVQAHVFHVTRDAEVAIKELETDDLLETIEEAVWRRRFRDVVRLQVDARMPASLVNILANNLEVKPAGIYRVEGALDLSRLRLLASLDRPELKDKPFLPRDCAGLQLGRRRPVRDDPAGGPAPASSLRFLPARDRISAQSRERPRRLGHQDDAVSRRPQLAGGGRAAGGGGKRQAGGRAGGAEGALRRRKQHRMGESVGARGRSRGLRAAGPEGALQSDAGGAARGRLDPALLPSRDGQLQPGHGAALHRHRIIHSE